MAQSIELQKLHLFVGTWMGDDIMHPTKFSPEGNAVTTYTGQLKLDGQFVIGDDIQEQDGQVTFRAHKVFGYDDIAKTYTFHFFDSFGANPVEPARGNWKGNQITFEQNSPRGHVRYTYQFEQEDLYRFQMELGGNLFIEGTYRRQ